MKKVLIANRGEIAVRIIRACHDLSLETVAVYSDVDKNALHVLHADEAVCIGSAPAKDSYLNIQNILSACEITGADAVHPGYGFLAENGRFAKLCSEAGIEFIGPSSETIEILGNKAVAKKTALDAGCPVIPGSKGVVKDEKSALAAAEEIGFPLFIKASAGGGGRGIRIAESREDFLRLFSAAKSEAKACFGCEDIYLEKKIDNPRHIEIQVLADKFGNVIHLGERDCTIQRRRQKLIEESPSPVVDSALRERMGLAAVNAVKAAGYHSAGTVEFLLDEKKNFYFMEVNTRIQVEHCVTEEVTGVDLVKEQLLIAQGKKLSLSQKDVTFSGHAFEFRINAEDPKNNFIAHPGKIENYLPPGGPGVRVDSACYAGYVIPPNYDALIAKLIVKGKDRIEAMQIARRALKEFHIDGIATTISFHEDMLDNQDFILGSGYSIDTIDSL